MEYQIIRRDAEEIVDAEGSLVVFVRPPLALLVVFPVALVVELKVPTSAFFYDVWSFSPWLDFTPCV